MNIFFKIAVNHARITRSYASVLLPMGHDSSSSKIRWVVFLFVSCWPPIWWMMSWLKAMFPKVPVGPGSAYPSSLKESLNLLADFQVIGIGPPSIR